MFSVHFNLIFDWIFDISLPILILNLKLINKILIKLNQILIKQLITPL